MPRRQSLGGDPGQVILTGDGMSDFGNLHFVAAEVVVGETLEP